MLRSRSLPRPPKPAALNIQPQFTAVHPQHAPNDFQSHPPGRPTPLQASMSQARRHQLLLGRAPNPPPAQPVAGWMQVSAGPGSRGLVCRVPPAGRAGTPVQGSRRAGCKAGLHQCFSLTHPCATSLSLPCPTRCRVPAGRGRMPAQARAAPSRRLTTRGGRWTPKTARTTA